MTYGSSIGYNRKKNRRWYLVNKTGRAMFVPRPLFPIKEALERAGL
jgi:hypothetical protein